ncbi:patatin-like phospholipase family protein [Agathobaculum sp.]|uniref:patatin-like phospholipase family protein n=1 Tax=Agathobaculum sp. TaxID=2048138 RepID=UPI002A806B44|nr:patatin family protein [Agathobaculum sp.]MDY3618394.1 patatin family protein [Agathobaculum sp.]
MPGLVLEGGTFRPVFSCGVMDALLDNDVMFDYVIGVSAGITYAFSYLSRQRGRNLEVLRRFRRDKRYMGARNLVHDRSIFGVDFVFDTIPNELVPFDWDTFRAFGGRIRVGVTNARTGKAEYLDGRGLDRPSTMLRATCAIPLYFPPVKIGGEIYYDGGLADPIPIVQSLRDGNEKNLIVLTQPDDYRKTLSRGSRAAVRALRRKYPEMAETMLSRPKRYNETVCFCRQLARKKPGDTVLLQPEARLNSFEKDVQKLEWGYEMGYNMACARLADIRRLFAE